MSNPPAGRDTDRNPHLTTARDSPGPAANAALILFSALLVTLEPRGFSSTLVLVLLALSIAAFVRRRIGQLEVWLVVAIAAIPALVSVGRERFRR